MNELQAVLDAIEELWRVGEAAALATVVCVEGSAYRRPGARMLIAPGGVRRIGSVSGGCLEGDVARKAWELTANGPAVLRYDSTAEDDGLWGLGLGCQGIVQVLVERVDVGHPLPVFLGECLRERRRGLVATVFAAGESTGVAVGARLLLRDDDAVAFVTGALLDQIPSLLTDATSSLAAGATVVARYELAGGRVEVLLETVAPPAELVVFGAGWDALPVVAAAKAVGWRVAVVDRRANFASRDRFQLADEWIVCQPNEIAQRVPISGRSSIVIMTHSYPDDLPMLHAALLSDAPYVGLLGPARRRERLLADLLDLEGFTPTPEQLARLHGPVGLDVGGDNPAEIAVSMMAEMLAVRHGRPGGPLRDRCAPIHEPVRSLQAV